jgi:hypothetical protein
LTRDDRHERDHHHDAENTLIHGNAPPIGNAEAIDATHPSTMTNPVNVMTNTINAALDFFTVSIR